MGPSIPLIQIACLVQNEPAKKRRPYKTKAKSEAKISN